MIFLLLALQQQPEIPAPRGLVNDFAGVVSAASAARLEAIATDVRTKSGGEIAIVTLPDLAGREPVDIGVRIGREWGVGAQAEIGDARRNAGAVILVVPKETAADNRGRCFVTTGQGTEGFLTDGEVASFCREATPYFQQQQYGAALELLTTRVAQEFAREFGFQLDTTLAAAPVQQPSRRRRGGFNPLLLFFLLFFVLPAIMGRGRRRRRGGFPGVIFIPPIGGGGWGGGWGSGGSWGGGGGGGFGGFGGGGGFSGGGGGSSW